MRLKFAVIGGDRRSVLLCRMLAQDGHRVHSFALERSELPEEIPKAGCLESALYGADCVVLPTPAERSGLLNAPYAALPCRIDELLPSLWPGQLLCGGRLSPELRQTADHGGVRVLDLMESPSFVTMNAAITAEGAVGLLLQESERTLWGSRVLVCGWGRIGRLLAWRLLALGAQVTVAARGSAHRAEARALGCEATDYPELPELLGFCDFVVNTVPARVLTPAMLCCLREDALLLELASPPGGFDRTAVENMGVRTLAAPGLPGRCAPWSAAALMRDEILCALAQEED